MSLDDNKQIVIKSFRLIETGDPQVARKIISPGFINLEARDDPEQDDRNRRGPEGFLATSAWLRSAFSGLRFEEFAAIAECDQVAVRAVRIGQHTGAFQGIAPTGKAFRQRQIHIFSIHDRQIRSHVAQRDDLGLLLELGWHPGRQDLHDRS